MIISKYQHDFYQLKKILASSHVIYSCVRYHIKFIAHT